MMFSLINEFSAAAWAAFSVAVLSAVWLCYPFIIFPACLRLFSKWMQGRMARTWFRPSSKPTSPKSIAVLFCAYNEEVVIRAKLENLVECSKAAPTPVKIRVFLDGCNDHSKAIAQEFAPEVEVVSSPCRVGKSHGMRVLAERCAEDILIFTDANVLFSPNLFSAAIDLFSSDATLGCVAGSTAFINKSASSNARIEGGYWKQEEKLKGLESTTGSCLCGTGAIFAIRRVLFIAPPDDIIDDFHTTLNILFQRKRVIQSDTLLVYERAATKSKDEWMRKVRITCRAYNCYRHLRVEIGRLPFLLQFIFYSHKWIRWLSAIPLTFFAVSSITLCIILSPTVGTGVLLMGLVALVLGLSGIRPFAECLAVVRAFYGTLWGVILSLKGERFVTWTPVVSTRASKEEVTAVKVL